MDLIIGAGITGLAYANFCSEDYLLLEAESEVGGYCRTIRQDGFVWDYSGHFFHFRDDEIRGWIMQRMSGESLVNVEKKSQIYYQGQFVDFPFQKNIHQLKKDEFIECLHDLYFSDRKSGNNFKQMLEGQFGKAICEKFLFPYNEKLYACDLDKLDQEAMGRFFPHADMDAIVRNMRNPDNNSYNSSFTYAQNGAQAYVDALYQGVDEGKVRLNERVSALDPENRCVETNQGKYTYDNLISTVPLPDLLRLSGADYPSELYTYNRVIVLNLGFDLPATNENHWIYYPDRDLCFYRVGFYSNILPSDRMSLYVEIGLDSNAPLESDKEYLRSAMADLQKTGIVSDQKLISWVCIKLDPAYVHINAACELDKKTQFAELARENIYSVGRYGGWRYCSIEDNMLEAKMLAEQLS